uniref:Major facilitator superfamily (MFS) profile domain-containing protein n=1 Tax=Picea sitchensis TaxID=3332 RepID=A9NWU3_PICSI|nr:unknown [Picea sitchensis]
MPDKAHTRTAMEDHSSACESPLLATPDNDLAEDGSTDLKGKPVRKSLTGGWTASLLIIGIEIAERLAYYGIASNLVTYLTNIMHQTTVTAVKNVNVWAGTASMLPLFGAFVADSYLGRYRTILISSIVYLLGLSLLTLSASLSSFRPPPCDITSYTCLKASGSQVGFFFFSLYLVALGQGGHKPCLQAFGADQFDERDPEERKYRSSFFNWWYFGMCSGLVVSISVLMYIQENVGWGLGFGIPTMAMAIALTVFLCGTRLYRHKLPGASPLTRIAQVFVATILKWNVPVPSQGEKNIYVIQEEQLLKGEKSRELLPKNQLRFLDKATVAVDLDYKHKDINWRLCTVTQVEEAKLVLRLLPIWVACLMYGVVFAQSPTFFTKQGSTMDRKIGENFEIPAASLQSFISLSILVLVPVYDRIFVPVARSITKNERGITLLQRIGIGIFISILSMTVAALTEMKRLQVAKDYGFEDMPHATIPLSIFWLLPQYILFGISDVFTMIGLQEYFYDQMPDTMRSVGIALYLSVFGIGSFLSSFFISIIEELSSGGKEQSWFADNLNRAHLDYFYWFLAALSALFLCIYVTFASCFIYKKVETDIFHDEETT